MIDAHLVTAYTALQTEVTRLAGGLSDLAQRATVYHHLYRASGGNHVFPLIAAHGALWAGGHFRNGLQLGRWLSWQSMFSARERRERCARLDDFANAFRDINRRVCIDTYANFHFTARFGHHPDAQAIVPTELLDALNLTHDAQARGSALDDESRRRVFSAHFMHEQQHVVGPSLQMAVAALNWPLLKRIALAPRVRFAYFPIGQTLQFRDFSRGEERIAHGQQAFSIAAAVGWDHVEAALHAYEVLPREFFADTVAYFRGLRERVLQAA